MTCKHFKLNSVAVVFGEHHTRPRGSDNMSTSAVFQWCLFSWVGVWGGGALHASLKSAPRRKNCGTELKLKNINNKRTTFVKKTSQHKKIFIVQKNKLFLTPTDIFYELYYILQYTFFCFSYPNYIVFGLCFKLNCYIFILTLNFNVFWHQMSSFWLHEHRFYAVVC